MFFVCHTQASQRLAAKEGTVDEANGSDRSTDEFTWTQEEETAVRRKLDKVIVPLTTFLYLLCFLDRYTAQLQLSIIGY